MQLSIANLLASGINANNEPSKNEERARKLERITVSVLPVFAEAAGLDLAELNLEEFLTIREARFPDVGDGDGEEQPA